MHTITCSFCCTQFALHEAHFRCTNLSCLGRAPDYVYTNARGSGTTKMGRVLVGQKRRSARGVACDICRATSTQRICPNCHFELSDDIGLVDQRTIAIIGGHATGKTHYIASLVTRLQNEVGTNFSITVRMADDYTRERWNREFYTPLFVHKTLLHPTLPIALDPQVKSPLIFRLTIGNGQHKRMLNLSFFDSAGEDMKSLAALSSPHYRYICHADAIIFLLDPLQIPSLRHRLTSTPLPALDPDAYPEHIVTRLHHLFKEENLLRANKVTIPIAFTLSKIDALLAAMGDDIEAGSELRKPGLHCGYVDVGEMQSVSTEVANYLRTWLSPNFCSIIAEDFAHYSYFGVSSLGEPPDAHNRLSIVSPVRVEDPLLWILYKFGLLKGRPGR
jgi:Double-GTPase 2